MKTLLPIILLLAVSLHAAVVSADSTRGAQVFELQGCVQCHSVDGVGPSIGTDLGLIVDRGFTPAATIVADLHLTRKRSFLHFPVERGSAEADALQHGMHTQKPVCLGHIRTAAAVL